MNPLFGGLALGLLGYKGAKDQNIASAEQAQRQMDFQREMSNTAIQRRMADLRKAGLNPILAGKHEATTPSGAMAPMVNRAAVALQNAASAANINNIIANTKKTIAETHRISPKATIGELINEAMTDPFASKQRFQEATGVNLSEFINSAYDALHNSKKKVSENRSGSRDPRNPTHWGRNKSSEAWMPRYEPKLLEKIRIKYPEKGEKYQYQKWRN
jgi:hypothetical protein